MHVSVVTPPAALIDPTTARARLGITADDGDDNTLAALIGAATEMLDGPEGWLGRALGQQTLLLSANHFPGLSCLENWRGWPNEYGHYHWQAIRLPYPPVQSVTSVTYLDQTGTRQTIYPSGYVLADRMLSPAPNLSWPAGLIQPGAVQITYVAGYQSGQIPARVLQSILLGVANLRSMSGPEAMLKVDATTGIGSQTFATAIEFGAVYDKTVSALLANLRVLD